MNGILERIRRALVRALYRLEVRGEGSPSLSAGTGALLVSNRASLADALLVAAAAPRPVRILGWRGLRATIRAARRMLQEGRAVFLFGEGAVSRTGCLLPFRRSLERVLRGSGAQAIPVAVDRDRGRFFRLEGGRVSWRLPTLLRPRARIVFGTPLPPESDVPRIRRAVQELQAEAYCLRRRPGDTLPARFIEMARRRLFAFSMTDHTGRRLGFRKALAAALALSRELERRLDGARNVGILLPPSIGSALANASLSMLGKVPVNLNYTLTREMAGKCAAKAGVRMVLTARAFLEKLGWPASGEMIFLEDIAAAIPRRVRILSYLAAQMLPAFLLKRLYARTSDPDAPAAILFSSGTTGDPKGVVLSHFNIISNVQAVCQVFRFDRRDRIAGVLPIYHSFGFTTGLWLPLIAGFGAAYYPNPLDARSVGRMIRENGVTALMAPPSFFHLYTRSCPAEDLRALRYAVSGAEKLKPSIAREFEEKFGLPILEGYGCTELSPVVSVNAADPGDRRRGGRKPGTIGRSIPGVAVKVVDPETWEELGTGAEGLLCVKGPNVMLGYLDSPEETARAIRDGWYGTGDMARLDAEGFIQITDRLARFAKIGGEMVPHGKVEELLGESLPGVEFAVTSLPCDRKGEKLAVLHTPLPRGIAPADICERIRNRGAPNLWLPRPENFIPVKEIPRTGTGKVEQRRLREIALAALAEAEIELTESAVPEGAGPS